MTESSHLLSEALRTCSTVHCGPNVKPGSWAPDGLNLCISSANGLGGRVHPWARAPGRGGQLDQLTAGQAVSTGEAHSTGGSTLADAITLP